MFDRTKTVYATVLVVILSLVAFGCASPTTPETTTTTVPGDGTPIGKDACADHPMVISFWGSNPVAGSNVYMGEQLVLTGQYETNRSADSAGVAFIREDGKTFIQDEAYGSSSCVRSLNTGGVITQDGLYQFGLGHVIDAVVVIGDPPIKSNLEVNWGNVRVQRKIPLGYRVVQQ